MPRIELGNDEPGIIGLFRYQPERAQPLSELADRRLSVTLEQIAAARDAGATLPHGYLAALG